VIVKSYEIERKVNKEFDFYLFYGVNEGFKNDVIDRCLLPIFPKNIYIYSENDILNDIGAFKEKIYNKSFFEEDKLVIINHATSKIADLAEEIINSKVKNLKLIIKSNILEKKSKLRIFFEKNKSCVCVAFYPDNELSLTKIAFQQLKDNNVTLSKEAINYLIKKSNGDRNHLITEIDKIRIFTKNKKITNEEVMKLINLSKEHEITELINNCLNQNTAKLKIILNDNIISHEDCIIIIRTFISKIKRLIKLIENYNEKGNLEESINTFKPSIFWKEKETVKKQILTWPKKQIKKMLYEINILELIVKKENNISSYLLANFILEKSFIRTNNI
jgi:DNA polymerase-3 subunit delta